MSEHQHRGPWAVWLNKEDLDRNGQPYKLSVGLVDERHVTEETAQWLRELLGAAELRDRAAEAKTNDRLKWQEVELVNLRDRLKIAEMALRGFGLVLEDGR